MSQPLQFYPELHLALCPVLALYPEHWLPSASLERLSSLLVEVFELLFLLLKTCWYSFFLCPPQLL